MAGKMIWLSAAARTVTAAVGSFLLAQAAAMAPAFAAACTTAADSAGGTICTGGSTVQQLTYVGSNGSYANGDFTLDLNNHDVTAGGILFTGTVNGDGVIILQNGSDVANATGNGLDASADAAGEDLTIDVRDTGSVSGSTNGIVAESDAGAVTITMNGKVTANAGDGIIAVTRTDGAIRVTTGDGSNINSDNDGIEATSVSGAITIKTGVDSVILGNVSSAGTGIFAQTSGAIEIVTGADSNASGATAGIEANSTGAGAVMVEMGADAGTGGSIGIKATSVSGAVTVTMRENSSAIGNVVNAGDGIIARSSGGGNVTVTMDESSFAFGSDDDGIEAGTTGTGTINITNNGLAIGGDTGIDAASGTGAIRITNGATGEIRNESDDIADLAIRTAGGAATIVNVGAIMGRIATGGSADRLDNDGIWITRGISDFGGGADTVNNRAVLVAGTEDDAAETTNLVGLETLTNTGVITLLDQFGGGSNISDRLTTSGNYIGQNGAELHVDVFLGGPGSLSDVLAVGGNTSGVTGIVINDINLGPGAFNPNGILVVDVTGIAQEGDFILADGPIDKGLFVYDLVFNNVDQLNDQFLLVSAADAEVFETLATVASSQEIWRETAAAWEGRQQAVRDRIAERVLVTAVADPPLSGGVAAESSLWFQALGSWTERNARVSGFDLDYDQSIYGFIAGADIGVSLGDDSTFLLGVLGGYVDSSLDFDTNSTSIKTDGATLGAYASFLHGRFFANILVKADVLELDYSAPSLAPDDVQDDADVTSFGGRADIGFRFGDSLFIEPMLSLDMISTSIDEFSVGGADIDPGTNDSIRGGAGLRLGVAAEMASVSVTGRVWDVFDNDNEVDITPAGPVLAISDDTLEGVYGEVAGQVDLDLSSSTVLFARGSLLFSDDVTRPSVSGGLSFFW